MKGHLLSKEVSKKKHGKQGKVKGRGQDSRRRKKKIVTVGLLGPCVRGRKFGREEGNLKGEKMKFREAQGHLKART